MVTYSPNSFFERGRGSIYKSPPKSTPTSKPKNANQQAAQSMLSVGIGGISGKTTTSSAQKIQDRFREETQKDSGSTKGLGAKPNITMEEVDTPNALTKKEKIYEALMAASAAVGLSAPQPTKAYTYNPMKVYTSEMVRPQGLVAYDAMFPTDATLNAANPPYSKTVGGNQQPLYTPDTRGFGQSIDNRALFERLDDPFRLGQGTDTTPNMGGEITNPNMDRITPTIPNPVIPESPSGVDPVSRAISQAMLPTEVNYTIQDGDTLSEIAREAGTTVEELKELNNIEDIDIIYAGSNLKVPVGSAKLTDTQAALRRGLGSKKDNKGIKVAGGTMEELAKLLRAYTDQMEGKITTDQVDDPDPDAQFYNSFNQDVTGSISMDKIKGDYVDGYLKGHEGVKAHSSLEGGKDTAAYGVKNSLGLKRSNYESDRDFAAAVALKHYEATEADFKAAKINQFGRDTNVSDVWEELGEAGRYALTDLHFNTGTVGSSAADGNAKDAMTNTLNYIGMTTKDGTKASLLSLSKRRAENWNKAADELGIDKIDKIQQVPTLGGGTVIKYLNKDGNVVHQVNSGRKPITLNKDGTYTDLTRTKEVKIK